MPKKVVKNHLKQKLQALGEIKQQKQFLVISFFA
jgi:hypothetical protein